MSGRSPGDERSAGAAAAAPDAADPDGSSAARAARYAERADRAAATARHLGVRSRRLANLRGLAFVVFVAALLSFLFGEGGVAALVGAGAGLGVFAWLAVLHARVLGQEDDALRRARVNRDALARVTGRWRDLPEDGARFLDPAHPYAVDLDVFGKGSLYQRLSVAHTRFGQDALARLLAAPSTADAIAARQRAVGALAAELELRQELEALALAVVEPPPARVDEAAARGGREGRREAPDPEPLLRWAEAEP
ncbi:MAG TPA: hypothetical protein PLU22_06880, partial [Polyangiaceae bacterium]|nr:hypothetical protein [Polyangiaceae bacterium]